jgi:hypothetical protein
MLAFATSSCGLLCLTFSEAAPVPKKTKSPLSPFVAKLLEILPPRAGFNSATEKEWSELETKMGTPLPRDYRDLYNHYGPIFINRSLLTYSPFYVQENKMTVWEENVEQFREMNESLHKKYPDTELPYWPAKGGFLPIAGTDNGVIIAWLTEGKPDEWPILVFQERSSQYDRHDMGYAEFLYKRLRGELQGNRFLAGTSLDPPHRAD